MMPVREIIESHQGKINAFLYRTTPCFRLTTDRFYTDIDPCSTAVGNLSSAVQINDEFKTSFMHITSDTHLHELARKRVEFRRHLVVYFVINGMLWLLWYLTGQGYPWPLWPMAGWGVGVIFHYLFDFRSSTLLSEEEEFKRLKKEMTEEERQAQ